MKNRLLAPLFVIVGLIASCVVANPTANAQQQTNVTKQTFSMTSTGYGPIIPLNGYSSCAILLDNIGSGMSMTALATSDANPTQNSQWATATNLGTSGVITTAGQTAGNIAGVGLTGFTFRITALSSGTVSGSVACSSANNGGSGGGGGTVTFPPYPWQVTISPLPVLVQPTNVPTLNVNCVSGGCPTPIPFPSPYFNFSPAPNGGAILGVVPVSPSGTPWPLNAGNQPIVQVSALPAAGPTSSPGNVPLVVPANASAQPYTATLPAPVAIQSALPAGTNTIGAVTVFQNSSGNVIATICDSTVKVAISSATTTSLVNASGSTKIYLCGATYSATGTVTTATLELEYGTGGGPCTSPTTITGAISIGTETAATIVTQLIPLNAIAWYATPASQQLCAVSNGTQAGNLLVYYAQHA